MSIKRKLIGTMLGISGVSVTVTVGAILLYLIYDIRQSKLAELEISASLSGSRNAAAIVFLDSEMAEQNLTVYEQDKNILLACLYDASGMLFAHHRKPKKTALICPPERTEEFKVPADLFEVWRPVMKQREEIGSILLVSNDEEINAYIQKMISISLLVILAFFPIVFVVTLYLQRTIAGPILNLTRTVQSITGSGDYSLRTQPDSYHDETGILAESFNKMLEEVQTKADALQYANRTLEDKVIERTRDLEKAVHKAEFANKAKTEFLRNMSHEFRTPLHAIVSFSAYGIEESGTADQETIRQYFGNIEKGGNRLIKLVNEVLNVARLEKGEQVFNMRRRNFNQVIEQCLQALNALAKQKRISFKVKPALDNIQCVFDFDRMVQVATNIIGNALKFSPEGSEISIRLNTVPVEKGDDVSYVVEVEISDEGPGIPEEELDSIFEAFVQSSITNTGAGGTGLGLAICKGILQVHEGEIRAFNNADKGARFVFRFPVNLPEGEVAYAHAA